MHRLVSGVQSYAVFHRERTTGQLGSGLTGGSRTPHHLWNIVVLACDRLEPCGRITLATGRHQWLDVLEVGGPDLAAAGIGPALLLA